MSDEDSDQSEESKPREQMIANMELVKRIFKPKVALADFEKLLKGVKIDEETNNTNVLENIAYSKALLLLLLGSDHRRRYNVLHIVVNDVQTMT